MVCLVVGTSGGRCLGPVGAVGGPMSSSQDGVQLSMEVTVGVPSYSTHPCMGLNTTPPRLVTPSNIQFQDMVPKKREPFIAVASKSDSRLVPGPWTIRLGFEETTLQYLLIHLTHLGSSRYTSVFVF